MEDGGATDDAEQQFTAEAALSSLHFWDFFKDGLNMLVRSATLQVWWTWSYPPSLLCQDKPDRLRLERGILTRQRSIRLKPYLVSSNWQLACSPGSSRPLSSSFICSALYFCSKVSSEGQTSAALVRVPAPAHAGHFFPGAFCGGAAGHGQPGGAPSGRTAVAADVICCGRLCCGRHRPRLPPGRQRRAGSAQVRVLSVHHVPTISWSHCKTARADIQSSDEEKA